MGMDIVSKLIAVHAIVQLATVVSMTCRCNYQLCIMYVATWLLHYN